MISDDQMTLETKRRRGLWMLLLSVALFLVLLLAKASWTVGRVRVDRLPDRNLDYRVDINTASWVELMQLPGVGPALAERIVEERESGGPYSSVEDLSRVRGIGPKTREQLAPYLVWDLTPSERDAPVENPARRVR